MTRVLLITNFAGAANAGGRALLCRLNHEALFAIFGTDLNVFELRKDRVASLGAAFRAFRGQIDGVNAATISQVTAEIYAHGIATVFVDGSNLGGMAWAIKRQFPSVHVISFFHNVEARFFFGAFLAKRNLRSLAVLGANYVAELFAVRGSDRIISLSQRDSILLRRLYGRPATEIMPLAVQDKWSGRIPDREPPREKYALFVGGLFYANEQGITWFVDHVASRLTIKTYVVGLGFDALRARLERGGMVKVVGSVENLAPWYEGAHLVIAPIFDGSGMKTKVAEALMFGKRIFGTPEAFSGYEDVASVAGAVCRTADDFVNAINRIAGHAAKAFDRDLRRLYEENYSFPAAVQRLRAFLAR